MSRQSERVNVNPKVMRWARETAALEPDDVARTLNVRVDTVKQLEDGSRKPTINTLQKLAVAYRRPLASLLLPEPPHEPPLPRDFRVLPDERKRALSRKTLLAIRRARYVQSVASEMLDSEGRTGLALADTGSATVHEDPELVAARERHRFPISLEDQRAFRSPHDAFRRWREAIEAFGIVVHQSRMPPEETRGFSLVDDGAPTIVVSFSDAIHAKIFTLFHEYGHVVLDVPGICSPEEASPRAHSDGVEVERFCNHFAGAFLVPREALLAHEHTRSIAGRLAPGRPELGRMASHFKVSTQVILRRLLICGVVSRQQYLQKLDELISVQRPRPKKKQAPRIAASRRCVLENGRFFVSLALDALARDTITYSDVADYLAVDLKNLDRVRELI